MSFQSGLITSANDLLDKIRLFASGSCNYSVEKYAADAGYYRLHLSHAASGQVVNLHSYSTYVSLYGSTSFDGALGYGSQTVATGSFSVTPLSGGAEYFLFGDDGWCYCVVQTGAAIYEPIFFGAMEKLCSFTGGAFLSNNYTTHVRADIDGATNKWKSGLSGNDMVIAFNGGVTRSLDGASPIAFNGVTPLYPVTLEVYRYVSGNGFRSLLGVAPGLRLLKMAGQYSNKDVVSMGGDDWMVFSHNYGGFALLK